MTASAASALVVFFAAACGRVGFDGVDAPPAEPALLQGSGTATTGTSAAVTLATPPAAGNVLVLVGAGHDDELEPPVGGAGAWQRAASSTLHPNVEIWIGVADGTATVSISTLAETGVTLWVGEWAGLATTDTIDAAAALPGTTSPATAGTITTTTAPTLVVFAVNDYLPNEFGAPTGGAWTELDTQRSDSVQRVWASIAHAPGELAPAVDETQHRWDAAVVALRARPR